MFADAQARVAALFAAHFGAAPDVCCQAPGRLNLIGEHLDYNGGAVLPLPLPQATHVALGLRPDAGEVRLVSDRAAAARFDAAAATPRPGGVWADYVQGVFVALGVRRGAAVAVLSEVPPGAGLSSSAALTVAVGRALRQACGLAVDDVGLALAAQRSETHFVGAAVGVMDPMVVSCGRPGHAMWLDTATLRAVHLPLPAALDLAVVHSGVAHAHAGGAYNSRRRECAAAAAALGVRHLCALATLPPRPPSMDPTLWRRARHAVAENARVGRALAALEGGDLAALGALVSASHASLRDDFEASVPAVEAVVDAAVRQPGVLGARMVGGGFGGGVLLVARQGAAAAAARALAAQLPDAVHVA